MGYAFRACNTHGRALFTLAHRAMAGHDEADYSVTDGNVSAAWRSGGTSATATCNEQLIGALQQRCHFEPGEVRVVLLDAQPIHRQRQEYRLVDAATGEFGRATSTLPTW